MTMSQHLCCSKSCTHVNINKRFWSCNQHSHVVLDVICTYHVLISINYLNAGLKINLQTTIFKCGLTINGSTVPCLDSTNDTVP